MLNDPGVRRKLAVIGLVLGSIGVASVLWAVFFGDAEWWTLIVLLPVLAVMRSMLRLARSSR